MYNINSSYHKDTNKLKYIKLLRNNKLTEREKKL